MNSPSVVADRAAAADVAHGAGRRSWTLEAIGVVVGDRTAAIGLAVILGLALVGVLAPWLAPYDPADQHVVDALQGPSAEYWLGTDEYGRDLLSRVVFGIRPAFLIGVLSVLLPMGLGIPIGIAAGYKMGWVDRAVSWAVDMMLSFPSLLMALMIVTLLGSGPWIVVIAIGIAHLPVFIRLARASALMAKGLDFVTASRSLGSGDLRIMFRHILPNIVGPLIIMGTLSIAGAIRQEASLSFLGLGIQPPAASWGNMIRDGIRNILQSPWMAVIPGLALTFSVLAFNMVGDALRDIFDPRGLTSDAKGKARGAGRP